MSGLGSETVLLRGPMGEADQSDELNQLKGDA